MLLRDCNVKMDGQDVDPKVLNNWLKTNDGFGETNEIDFEAFTSLGFTHEATTSDLNLIKKYFKKGARAVLEVSDGPHWVVITAYSLNYFLVNDPLVNANSYPQSATKNAEIIYNPRCKSYAEEVVDPTIE